MPDRTPIDITNIPELVRIAEEVEATKTPRELRRENKPVAVITLVTGAKKARKPKPRQTTKHLNGQQGVGRMLIQTP